MAAFEIYCLPQGRKLKGEEINILMYPEAVCNSQCHGSPRSVTWRFITEVCSVDARSQMALFPVFPTMPSSRAPSGVCEVVGDDKRCRSGSLKRILT